MDLDRPRNLLRHEVLPRLSAREIDLRQRALALGSAAAGARRTIERLLERRLGLAEQPPDRPSLEDLAALPESLWPYLLGLLHRRAGAGYPPGSRALEELRQAVRRAQRSGSRVGVDCGNGWHWRSDDGSLEIVHRPLSRTSRSPAGFAYTVVAPGSVVIPETGHRLRLSRQNVAPWMFRGSPNRTGLALDLGSAGRIQVRSRRPGDRIRPLGCSYERRLKEVLIDRRVPRRDRSRLPLLCVDERIVWVPGVTIDDGCRVPADGSEVWVAELLTE